MGKPTAITSLGLLSKQTMLCLSLGAGLAGGILPANAAFVLEAPEPEEVQAPSPVFNESEYMVWVDHTYDAVVQYGRADLITKAPSFGDKMPLEDALKIIVPEEWVVLRFRDLTADGRLEVNWDMKSADWIEVLRNLGERYGLRFHVDHAKQEIFIQNGRKLIFDRAIHASGSPGSEVMVRDDLAEPIKVNSSPVPPKPTTKATFSINQGDDAESVMRDLSLMLGYSQLYWLMPRLTVEERQTWNGEPSEVLAQAANSFNGRICLYQDNVAAVVSRSMECPQ